MSIKKSGMISIVGRPNVGKSTLTNALVGEKGAIVSNKPQTTRNRICAILNRGESQFVFLDTPGLHKPRTKLSEYMNQQVTDSVADVDVAVLVVEPMGEIHKAEQDLIASFRSSTANSFIPLGTETIAVMILWIFIIAAVIEFAIELNSYIAKLGSGGGATLDRAATKRGVAGQMMQTAERLAVATGVRAVAGKVGSAIQGRKNSGNSKNGADSRRSNDSGRNGSENSSESNPRNNE